MRAHQFVLLLGERERGKERERGVEVKIMGVLLVMFLAQMSIPTAVSSKNWDRTVWSWLL